MKMTSTPTMFYIKVTYPLGIQIPQQLLNDSFTDYLKLLEENLGVHFDFIQAKDTHLNIYCSSSFPIEWALQKRQNHSIEISGQNRNFKFKNYKRSFEDQLLENIESTLQDISEKVFSAFEVQIKTPIEIQWELI